VYTSVTQEMVAIGITPKRGQSPEAGGDVRPLNISMSGRHSCRDQEVDLSPLQSRNMNSNSNDRAMHGYRAVATTVDHTSQLRRYQFARMSWSSRDNRKIRACGDV